MPGTHSDRDVVWKRVWRYKLHLDPEALERSPASVGDAYDHGWVASDLLRDILAPFPTGLLRWWSSQEVGHVVFTHAPSRYCQGISEWRERKLAGICYLSLRDLLVAPDAALEVWMRMLDHLLGSLGQASGGRFSDGMGANPRLEEAAQRFAQAFALGYGAQECDCGDAQSYFGVSVRLFRDDPQRLGIVDPLTERILRQALLSEAFWEREP